MSRAAHILTKDLRKQPLSLADLEILYEQELKAKVEL